MQLEEKKVRGAPCLSEARFSKSGEACEPRFRLTCSVLIRTVFISGHFACSCKFLMITIGPQCCAYYDTVHSNLMAGVNSTSGADHLKWDLVHGSRPSQTLLCLTESGVPSHERKYMRKTPWCLPTQRDPNRYTSQYGKTKGNMAHKSGNNSQCT